MAPVGDFGFRLLDGGGFGQVVAFLSERFAFRLCVGEFFRDLVESLRYRIIGDEDLFLWGVGTRLGDSQFRH